MKKFLSLLMIAAVMASVVVINKETVNAAGTTTGINYASLGYLEDCTVSAPVDLSVAVTYICGGSNGIDISDANAIAIFFRYTSSNANTGYRCYPQFKDEKFVNSGGLVTWTDPTTFKVVSGGVQLSDMNIKANQLLSNESGFVLPVGYSRFRISCEGITGASGSETSIGAAGDTLSVAVRKMLAP